ncbi:hypothetical protein CRE_16085 [Caenorhabditis remanei]|uniref:PAN-3 domain-containing protein n=1 Tax=Caenorhabditis remanei TaxID=31234 RepID=E3MBQ4_CAERE|nr:hypothetical protein CRE_16085 [Caenorhabditis remanei]
MVTVWGHPDPTTSKLAAKYMNGINWKTCVDSCFKDATCLLAYGNSSEYCGMYTFGDVSKVENLETVALDKVSFRITSAPETCEPVPQMISVFERYCELGTWMLAGQWTGCNKIYLEAVDYTTAKKICVSMVGALMIIPASKDWFWIRTSTDIVIPRCFDSQCTIHFGIQMTDSNVIQKTRIEKTRIQFLDWTLPELMGDDSGYLWAENEPNPEK